MRTLFLTSHFLGWALETGSESQRNECVFRWTQGQAQIDIDHAHAHLAGWESGVDFRRGQHEFCWTVRNYVGPESLYRRFKSLCTCLYFLFSCERRIIVSFYKSEVVDSSLVLVLVSALLFLPISYMVKSEKPWIRFLKTNFSSWFGCVPVTFLLCMRRKRFTVC